MSVDKIILDAYHMRVNNTVPLRVLYRTSGSLPGEPFEVGAA